MNVTTNDPVESLDPATDSVDPADPAIDRVAAATAAALATLALAGCAGGESQSPQSLMNGDGVTGPAPSTMFMTGTTLAAEKQPSTDDVVRFLSQATFGPVSPEEITAVKAYGYDAWFAHQWRIDPGSHLDYLRQQARSTEDNRPTDAMSYEAIWQQWLYSPGQLRARVAFALSQIFVVSNIAPDLNPWAMSSYLDMLNRNAFGNYRQLLEDVTRHPAMGYYLNMLGSRKEDPESGQHPNENYAREVLQLFSIGLVKLNPDGSAQRDGQGAVIPTYGQEAVLGFARAFSGWSFAGRNTADAGAFDGGEENWIDPMRPWPSQHSTGTKTLLDGATIGAGGSPESDLRAALDVIFMHPNVAPFISRRLIQRLVTSNPSPAYLARIAAVFADNGAGVRGDLKAVVRAILLDAEARDPLAAASTTAGKQREPVIRFANFLRALGAKAPNGRNAIHYLDSGDDGLGQSPLLAPSVFNFFSPDFRQPGAVAQAGLSSPEFQITTETTVVGTLNFFARLIDHGGYGAWGEDDSRLALDFKPLEAIAHDPAALVERLNLLFMNRAISDLSRTTMTTAISAIDAGARSERVRAALVLTSIAPEFVIQR